MCVISHAYIGLYSVGLLSSNRASGVYGREVIHSIVVKPRLTAVEQLFDMWLERFLSCRANLLYL